MRRYRTAPGFWGLGIVRSPGGWTIQLGGWCFTTEPG